MRTVLAGMAMLYAGPGSAQQPDGAGPHRAGEQSATAQDVRQAFQFEPGAQARRRSDGVLARRVDAGDGAPERQAATTSMRRQNNRVLGRIDMRLANRISGLAKSDGDVTDGMRRGTTASR